MYPSGVMDPTRPVRQVGGDRVSPAGAVRERKPLAPAVRADPADLSGTDLHEPQRVVPAARDADRRRMLRGKRVDRDLSTQADAADGVRLVQGEPQRVIGTSG